MDCPPSRLPPSPAQIASMVSNTERSCPNTTIGEMNEEILDRPTSNLEFWFFLKFMILCNAYKIKSWVIPAWFVFCHTYIFTNKLSQVNYCECFFTIIMMIIMMEKIPIQFEWIQNFVTVRIVINNSTVLIH